MKRRKIRIKAGDIIEIPLESALRAYARVYEDCGYAPYQFVSSVRPSSVDLIVRRQTLGVYIVFEFKTETGEWPIVGQHTFSNLEDKWPPARREPIPSLPGRYQVIERGNLREALPGDDTLPINVRLDEKSFVSVIRDKLRGCRIWPADIPYEPDP